MEALTFNPFDLVPLLAAGPVLVGYWPLLMFVGFAAMPV